MDDCGHDHHHHDDAFDEDVPLLFYPEEDYRERAAAREHPLWTWLAIASIIGIGLAVLHHFQGV
jgi:hypothetical protein